MYRLGLNIWPKKSHFRPKMAVSAVNNSFGRKFSYGRNFGYGQISAFIELYLTDTAFRKKSSFGHTLDKYIASIGYYQM